MNAKCFLFILKQSYIFHYIICMNVPLNLIWLPLLYVPRKSSFISTQFLILNLTSWLSLLPHELILFRITIFEAALSASAAKYLAWSRSFWLYLYVFTYIFTNIFSHFFNKRQKLMAFYKYFIFMFNWMAVLFYILHFN